jgi:DNA-binding IclR family transcriptional regulator
MVQTSVRSLATDLGLAKDTVGRAVTRLGRAGLVEFVGAPFERGSYRLTVPADVLSLERSARVNRPLPSRRRIGMPLVSQLSLLDRD